MAGEKSFQIEAFQFSPQHVGHLVRHDNGGPDGYEGFTRILGYYWNDEEEGEPVLKIIVAGGKEITFKNDAEIELYDGQPA